MNLADLSIRSENFGDLILSESIPDHLINHLLPGTLPWVACCPSGHLLFQEIRGKDYSAWHTSILLQRDDQFIVSVKQPVLAMHFFLQQDFLLANLPIQEQLVFHEGEYNMSFLSPFEFSLKISTNKVYKCLTLSYSHDYLYKIAAGYPVMNELVEKSNLLPFAYLCPNNKLITEEMKRSLDTFLHCPCKVEETRRIIQRGKTWELLVQVLEQASRHSAFAGSTLSQCYVEKIHVAKEYLDQHYCTPITLFELAKKVGMNVHKLSTGFLQITGTTVFCYHRQVRMLKAIQLLQETDRDLFDIGTEIGYADGKCFSKEFKKDKGITPIEYRRQFRMQHR
jgi:YesN/AraC family two-component response regulator